MDDLIDRGEPSGLPLGAEPAPAARGVNDGEVTVSELSGRIKRAMEDAFGHVRLRAEIGRVSRPRSGHLYLDLKDDKAVLSAVVWRGVAQRLEIQPQEGLEVIAEGRVTTFPGQSKYQLVIERLAPAGAGALMAMLEERKQRLAAEGLFAPERKQGLPFLPDVIGVVTSPSGAVIRDILHRLAERFPRRVLVWPVKVQGEGSAAEVAAAVRGFDRIAPGGPVPRPDVLIVARGGGSVEDLWGFNDEAVVRAVADCRIPVISAVGHETDTTLIDFAADRRAPTPTAAAEMAAPVRSELAASLAGLEQRRLMAGRRMLAERRDGLKALARALPRPDSLTQAARQRLDYAAERLPRALLSAAAARRAQLGRVDARLSPALLRRRLEQGAERARLFGERLGPALSRAAARARERYEQGRFAPRIARAAATDLSARGERLEKLGRLLTGFSYKATLDRGFAAVRSAGAVVGSAAGLGPGARIEVEFRDGRIEAETLEGEEGAAPRPTKPARGARGTGETGGAGDQSGGQGSLF